MVTTLPAARSSSVMGCCGCFILSFSGHFVHVSFSVSVCSQRLIVVMLLREDSPLFKGLFKSTLLIFSVFCGARL